MACEVRARAPRRPFRSSLHRRDVGRSAGRRGGIWGVKKGKYFAFWVKHCVVVDNGVLYEWADSKGGYNRTAIGNFGWPSKGITIRKF